MEIIKANENVYKAAGYDASEAVNLQIRGNLMIQLDAFIKDAGMTQKQAADFFGVHQPRISDLINGHIDKFTIDMLVNMLSKAGRTISMQVLEPA